MRTELYKKPIIEISKNLLFLLIISINLREPYFHTRELLFFLFIFFSIPFGNYKKIINILLYLTIWGVSLIYNVIVPGSNVIDGVWFQGIIISSYLFLMVFSTKEYRDVIIKGFITSATIVSIITIILWLVCWFIPAIRTALIAYFSLLYEKTNLSFIGIDTRMIVGIPFFFVWYRTIPIVIPALGYFYVKRLKGQKTRKNAFYIIIYTIALILSGTRADILVAFMLLFFYIAFFLMQKHRFFIAICIVLAGLYGGLMAANAFLHDKGSNSTAIKTLHQISYFNTFDSDLIRTIFFGWGYGSTFYTLGRNKFVDVTELSHWESIRRYGFISFIMIMTCIWLKPLINIFIKEKYVIRYFYIIWVLSFVFVACTNPYLLDSLGFCVLLFFDVCFQFDVSTTKKRITHD